jgi:hypothetical protein
MVRRDAVSGARKQTAYAYVFWRVARHPPLIRSPIFQKRTSRRGICEFTEATGRLRSLLESSAAKGRQYDVQNIPAAYGAVRAALVSG